MFSQQLLTNCQRVQYLPCTQSNKIAFSALMGKNPRQKSLWTKLWLVFFCRKNQCLRSIPWIQEQLTTAHRPALTLLMQNGFICLLCLNGSSCTIPLPSQQLAERSPHGLLCAQMASSPPWAHCCMGLALLHCLHQLLPNPSQIPKAQSWVHLQAPGLPNPAVNTALGIFSLQIQHKQLFGPERALSILGTFFCDTHGLPICISLSPTSTGATHHKAAAKPLPALLTILSTEHSPAGPQKMLSLHISQGRSPQPPPRD